MNYNKITIKAYNQPINSFEDLATDLDLFVKELKINYKFNLLGLSMGGSVAFTYAGKFPNQVKNLFTIGALGPVSLKFYFKILKNN